MTLEQLETLAKLMRGDKQSLAYQGAKLVLVDGMSQVDATNVLMTKANTINNGVTRYRNAHEEIKKVYSINK